MAPPTQSCTTCDNKLHDHSLNFKNDNEEIKNEPCDIPLDQNHSLRFGTIGSYILGGLFIGLYGFGLYILYSEYSTIYFQKITAAHAVPNQLRRWAPFYLVAIIMEGVYAYLKGDPVYKTGDSICSATTFIARGVTQRMIAMSLICYSTYGLVWDYYGVYIHKSVFPLFLQNSPLFQFLTIIICDEFVYYWVHRFGHTMHIFWNFHQLHHNGEVMNFGTSLRNSVIVRFSTTMFYLPLALFFDPPVFIIFRQFNLLYQVWVHTEFIGKLGWIEYVLNTPSQHRVHHGRNEYCIDKNFGGMTCIFDRLFGTYQEELEEIPPVYGLTAPIDSHDPWKLNWYPWYNTYKAMSSVKGLKNKLVILWNGPGYIPNSNPPKEYPIPPITRNTFNIRNPVFSKGAKTLLIFELCLTMVIFTVSDKTLGDNIHNWYLTTVVAFAGFCSYTISASNDKLSGSTMIQIVTIIAGICLFSYGSYSRYQPEIFVKTFTEIFVYLSIGLFLIFAVITYKQELESSLSINEIARDLPEAKQAYKNQVEYYKLSQKQKTN